MDVFAIGLNPNTQPIIAMRFLKNSLGYFLKDCKDTVRALEKNHPTVINVPSHAVQEDFDGLKEHFIIAEGEAQIFRIEDTLRPVTNDLLRAYQLASLQNHKLRPALEAILTHMQGM